MNEVLLSIATVTGVELTGNKSYVLREDNSDENNIKGQ